MRARPQRLAECSEDQTADAPADEEYCGDLLAGGLNLGFRARLPAKSSMPELVPVKTVAGPKQSNNHAPLATNNTNQLVARQLVCPALAF